MGGPRSSGLAVPGGRSEATQTATGLSRTAVAGADGGYVLTNLPVGPYMLEISKEGFTKYVQSASWLPSRQQSDGRRHIKGRLGLRTSGGPGGRNHIELIAISGMPIPAPAAAR